MCISDTFIFENFVIKNTDLFANNIISKLFYSISIKHIHISTNCTSQIIRNAS